MDRTAAMILVFILIVPSMCRSVELTGEEIINEVDSISHVDTGYSKVEMSITTTSGGIRTFVYESWSMNDGEKTLIRYLEPRRAKDQAVLMLNHSDDIWMYFPRTERVRKLASHAKKQKMQGGDFSYEDMGGGGEFIDDFTSRRLDDEEMNGYDCYKLELLRKESSDVSYSRLIMWVIKENFYPIAIDYYSENDGSRLEKTLVQSDIEVIEDIPTAKHMVMTNRNDNSKTTIDLLEIDYDIDLDKDLFTERGLRK